MQSKINSTINPQKVKVKNKLVASKKKETNVTIAISNFLATISIKTNSKKGFVEHLGSSRMTFCSAVAAAISRIIGK